MGKFEMSDRIDHRRRRFVPMRDCHADALFIITHGSSCTLSEVPRHRADGRTDRGEGPGKSERRLRKLPVDIGAL